MNTDLQNSPEYQAYLEHKASVPIPEFQGDSAKTLFLYNVKQGPIGTSEDSYCAYLKYEYGITDPILYHKQMIKEGYLCPCSNKEKALSCTVQQLKSFLSELGLKQTGKKDELIERLISAISEEKAQELFGDILWYQLSDLGKDWLDKHQEHLVHHFEGNIGIDRKIHNAIKAKTNDEYFEKAQAALLKRMKVRGENHCARWYDLFNLYKKHHYKDDEVKAVIHIIYFQLNDPYDLDGVAKKNWNLQIDAKRESQELFKPMLAPGLLSVLRNYESQYLENTDNVKNMIHVAFEDFPLPYAVFDENEFKEIISRFILNECDYQKMEIELSRPWPGKQDDRNIERLSSWLQPMQAEIDDILSDEEQNSLAQNDLQKNGRNSKQSKTKVKRSPEEIATEKAEKENIRQLKEAEKKRIREEKERQKAEKAELRRLKYGPFTQEELKKKAIEWLNELPETADIMRRKERAYDISLLDSFDEYGKAEICGSQGDVYETSLSQCTCPDYRFRRSSACKHQIALARFMAYGENKLPYQPLVDSKSDIIQNYCADVFASSPAESIQNSSISNLPTDSIKKSSIPKWIYVVIIGILIAIVFAILR